MKGLELSKEYYNEFGREMLKQNYSEYLDKMAVGLVGEGSECFGYDDVYSYNHDFGPGFCIWIPKIIWDDIGAELQRDYMRLPKRFKGFERIVTPQGMGRVGVITIEQFYQKYTGLTHAPENNLQWFAIPEHFLATAVNGKVFCDRYGEFTKIRKLLQSFYPEDVVKKKLAARMAVMAQSGQYNYARCMKRKEFGAAYLACGEFIKSAISSIYLLNDTYMPFYKWAFKGMEKLSLFQNCLPHLKTLYMLNDSVENTKKKIELVEIVCVEIGTELKRRGWSSAQDDFLQAHGESLMKAIKDPRLAAMHIMTDCKY